MAFGAADIPFLPRGVRLHECTVRKGWFLLAPERALKMDQIGVAILSAVDGVRDFQAVVQKLAADFKVPEAQIAGDVDKFMTDLKNRRMLEIRP